MHKTGSFGVVSEFVDKLLHVFYFHLLALEGFFLALSVLNSHFLEHIVVTFIIVELLVIEMNHLVACDIEELSSVRDDNDCIFTA